MYYVDVFFLFFFPKLSNEKKTNVNEGKLSKTIAAKILLQIIKHHSNIFFLSFSNHKLLNFAE
jgi:hypothetical protein